MASIGLTSACKNSMAFCLSDTGAGRSTQEGGLNFSLMPTNQWHVSFSEFLLPKDQGKFVGEEEPLLERL